MQLKILLAVLFISVIFCSGWTKQKTFVCLNNKPITADTVLKPVNEFNRGDKIYYLFVSKKQLKNKFIRVQVFKIDDLWVRGGAELVMTKDYRLMKDEVYYHTNYFVLHASGRYVVQIWDPEDLNVPLAGNEFKVW